LHVQTKNIKCAAKLIVEAANTEIVQSDCIAKLPNAMAWTMNARRQ
jgi:hypothetical protein